MIAIDLTSTEKSLGRGLGLFLFLIGGVLFFYYSSQRAIKVLARSYEALD